MRSKLPPTSSRKNVGSLLCFFLFLNKPKWNYIITRVEHPAQDVQKMSAPKEYTVTGAYKTKAPSGHKNNYKWTPIHKSGCFHRSWKLYTNDTWFDFNQTKEFSLTFSMRAKWSNTILLKTQLFWSFQRTQTPASQITLKNIWVDWGMHAI